MNRVIGVPYSFKLDDDVPTMGVITNGTVFYSGSVFVSGITYATPTYTTYQPARKPYKETDSKRTANGFHHGKNWTCFGIWIQSTCWDYGREIYGGRYNIVKNCNKCGSEAEWLYKFNIRTMKHVMWGYLCLECSAAGPKKRLVISEMLEEVV